MRRALVVLAWAGALAAAFRLVPSLAERHAEDFLYYYAGTALYWEGASPYDYGAYQGRIEALLGRENPFPSKTSAFLYPPLTAWLFGPFAALPPDPSYLAWSALLALAAAAAWRALALASESGPAAAALLGCVLFLCPGMDNAVYLHRVLFVSLAAFLAGLLAARRRREFWLGAAFGLLGLQPQWLAVGALCLALGRRWRALGVAAGVNAATLLPYLFGLRPWGEVADYVSNAAGVGGGLVFGGNLSLAAGIYRLLRPEAFAGGALFVPADALYRALWWGSAAAAAAALAWLWRRGESWERKTAWTFALALWVQPYSHGSEVLWALPGIVLLLRRLWPDEEAFERALLGAAGLTLALRWALDFPAGRPHLAGAYLAAATLAAGWKTIRTRSG